jgi:hypothetical protein
MRLFRTALLTTLLLGAAAPAFADATLFVGSTTTPANRTVRGFSVGFSVLVVGLEFEYANTSEEADKGAPELITGMGNLLLQTPLPILGLQPYVTAGGGGYRERLGTAQETFVGLNTGGGVKISLLGPVRARIDYRVFKLNGDPLHSTVHRVYAGVNLAF